MTLRLLSEFIKIKFVFLKHQDKKFPLFVNYYLNCLLQRTLVYHGESLQSTTHIVSYTGDPPDTEWTWHAAITRHIHRSFPTCLITFQQVRTICWLPYTFLDFLNFVWSSSAPNKVFYSWSRTLLTPLDPNMNFDGINIFIFTLQALLHIFASLVRISLQDASFIVRVSS